MSRLVHLAGIKVFDFHPVRVYLNTEHMNRYEKTRDLHHSPLKLRAHRYEGDGTRRRFLEFLRIVSLAQFNS
jgi:hypothetical protein